MFVGKSRINYISLGKNKKRKNTRLTLCLIKLTYILFVFYLARNGSAAKKF